MLRTLLEAVRRGEKSVDAALAALATLPFEAVGETATIDRHRHLRSGIPEVVFGLGKTGEQIAEIMTALAAHGGNVLATRVDAAKAAIVRAALPQAAFHPTAQALVIEQAPISSEGRGQVLVVSAGTSDAAVVAEAVLTLRLFGHEVGKVVDVGVAGVHRTLARLGELRAAEVLIVVAGMEGALPSLVAGLVDRPVIAVPTSVGYGASFGGIAALLGMLTSCAAGVTVVNIDNGFGAAVAAAAINRRRA
jgi:pyridinium-3,5-biscarboxylic acid mononucleotide synthase